MTKEQERGLVFLLCVGLLVGGCVLLWPVPRGGPTMWARPIAVADVVVVVPVFVEPKKIDVNAASAAELTELPGIGPVLAARILAYRAEHGTFRTLDELTAVKGIGPSTVEGLREFAVAESGG
ncbi:MAG: helix-hairpin-helix domain-containing protein [Candidatus Bipolaricaulota bacterium]|nr:helix-hairpin-helix domain-containing protein [Candidatus Bipolaricaulota bacterium]